MTSMNTYNNGSSMSALSQNFSTLSVGQSSVLPTTSTYVSSVPSTTSTYISSAPSTTTTILPTSTTSTYVASSIPVTTTSTYVSSAPVVAPMVTPIAQAVPSNMLPAPINDGTRYARLTGEKSRTRRSRKLLVQPLAGTGLQTLPAGVPAEGLQAAQQAAMMGGVAGGVGTNMLPAPINDGTRYARLTGQKSRSARSRKLLVQPLNGTGLQTLPAGVPVEGLGAGGVPLPGRRARRTMARMNAANGTGLNNGLAAGAMPLAGMPLASGMPLSSGMVQPTTALTAPHLAQIPLGTAKLTRSQKRNARRRNARLGQNGMLAQPGMVNSNLIGQPMLAQQPLLAQPMMMMMKPQETILTQPTSLVGTPMF